MAIEDNLPAVDPAAAATVVEPAAPAAPEFTPHTDTPSLLQGVGAEPVVKTPAAEPVADPAATVEPTKPEEPKPGDPAATTTEPLAPEPAAPEPITYPEFTLPDGLVPDPTIMGKYTETLGKYGVKPEAAQELLNMHAEAFKTYQAQTLAAQHEAFGKMREQWRNQVMSDPQLGGSGHQTAMGAVARMRDMLVSNAKLGSEQYVKDTKELNDFLATTGAGDHPVFLRMLHRAARYLDEAAMPPPNPGVPPNIGTKPKGLRSIYNGTRT
ncbi:MAG TPA: hypothetical protein PLO16_12680 [Acidocella sp.]|nr:hypothetical protein [Acidocella sp.]